MESKDQPSRRSRLCGRRRSCEWIPLNLVSKMIRTSRDTKGHLVPAVEWIPGKRQCQEKVRHFEYRNRKLGPEHRYLLRIPRLGKGLAPYGCTGPLRNRLAFSCTDTTFECLSISLSSSEISAGFALLFVNLQEVEIADEAILLGSIQSMIRSHSC
jgi:hypothetical protein